MSRVLLAICFLSFTPLLQAQPMIDHGMVLATAMDVAPGKLKDTVNLADTTNYVFRGRLITLNAEKTVHLCFDTEHMRVAGAWVGKYPSYRADKNMGPPVEGTMLFSTRPGPGFARAGKWDDPRSGKEGPLPRDWAHYRGLFVHGDQVILSYTVGTTALLEKPGLAKLGDQPMLVRAFEMGPSTEPIRILACEDANATAQVGDVDTKSALLVKNGSKLFVGLIGVPGRVLADAGKVVIEIPPAKTSQLFEIAYAQLPAVVDAKTEADYKARQPGPLLPLLKGGPARWKQELVARGTPGPSDKGPYTSDEFELPEKNPWNVPIRPGALDFFSDGRAAISTWDGDVWIVSGLDEKLQNVKWRRFASGLQHPLGLKIVKDVIYTAGRDQITRLIDSNGDGEADFYENFNNDAGLTLQRHEFVMDLQTDAQGNFYYCRSGHYIPSKKGENCCVIKLPPDGSKMEVIARGFREPNGMGIGPDGTMTVGDNEGNNIPQTPLYHLKPGEFYGFTPSSNEKGRVVGNWKYTVKPIVWLPKQVDRSAGGQVWVTSDKFGPLAGQLLHTSYGQCALYSVLIDKTAEPWQGAVWRFPLYFQSGIMRARFSPTDGQLYLCGLRGWDTNAGKDGVFARVRYTGVSQPVPVGFRVTSKGMEVAFSEPLEKKSAEDDQNWAGTWVKTFSAKGAEKKDEMPLDAMRLSNDGKTVSITLEQVIPVVNFTLQYRLKDTRSKTVAGELHGTIHHVP